MYLPNMSLKLSVRRKSIARKVGSATRATVTQLGSSALATLVAMGIAGMVQLNPRIAQAQASPVSTPAKNATHARPSRQISSAASSASPLAVAHGAGATVLPSEGAYIHRWTAADGEPFVILNRKPEEPTSEERYQIENEFNARPEPQIAGHPQEIQNKELALANRAREQALELVQTQPGSQPAKTGNLKHQMEMANRAREEALRLAQIQAGK